jgi:tetratricopeptide (TPR) repeat protein
VLMRKCFLVCVLFCLGLATLSSVSNSWSFLNDDLEYGAIIAEVYNLGDPGKASRLLDDYYEAAGTRRYHSWQESLAKGKAAMTVARFLQDSKDKKAARQRMNEAKAFYDEAEANGAPQAAIQTAQALWSSFSFLIFGNLGDGLSYTKILDKAYEADGGEDIVLLINEGARYAYSPGFAGGSSKKALALLEQALSNMSRAELGKWDEYGLYSALGYAYDDQKQKDKALEFCNKAMALYTGDPYVLEILEKYSK